MFPILDVANSSASKPIPVFCCPVVDSRPASSPTNVVPRVVDPYNIRKPLSDSPAVGLSIFILPATVNRALALEVVPMPRLSVKLVRYVVTPPSVKSEDPPLIPSVEVATQRVEVPVVRRTIPLVPTAESPSRKAPVSVKSVMVVVARVEVPKMARVPVATRLPPKKPLPATVSLLPGVVVPMPTLPVATIKDGLVLFVNRVVEAVPVIVSVPPISAS